MSDRKKFYTASEAAEKFGVDRRTISRWVTSGKIKAVVTAGGHRRIPHKEVETLLDQNGFSEPTPSTPSILIVDDDRAVRRTMAQRLSREGFLVETAADGFKAGLKALEMHPDLIVLDLVMEGMDGFEVCRTIRANSAFNHTKIMILTGFGTPENRERAFRAGADDYHRKGGEPKDFLKAVKALLTK